MTTTTLTRTYTILTCCYSGCGVTFAMDKQFEQNRRDDHAWWYCLNGHKQHFGGKSDEEKALEAQRKAEQQAQWARESRDAALAQAEHERRSAAATRGHLTRQRRRAANGVCPCCSRTFKDLARHVAGQHPDYVEATKPASA